MKVQIFTDGASRGNPGQAGIGIVVKKDGKVLLEVSDYIGKTTNNIAEYVAAIRGLLEALLLGGEEAEFFSDSELLVKQIKGEYKVKSEALMPLHYQAQVLIRKFKKVSILHTKRDGNAYADALANRGIDSLRHSLA